MSPYAEYGNDLVQLGLEDADSPLTLVQLRNQYKKLSLFWHPDKNPENVRECTEKFQALSNSYNRLFQYIHNCTDKTTISGEELNLYECFNLYNQVKENIGSVTVKIEKSRVSQWETVTSSIYGPATTNKENERV